MNSMIQFAAPLVLLSIAAVEDGKKQKISDSVLSLLWLSLLVFAPSGLAAAAGVFAAVYILNTLSLYLKKPIFGWADVLLLPPYAGFLFAMGQPFVALAGPAWMFIDVAIKKKPAALAPFCLAAFLLGLLFAFYPTFEAAFISLASY